MQVCCSFCLSGLLHGTYWKNYRFFKGVQRGMQKSLWITRELLICNVFRDAKVLPPKCKSPNLCGRTEHRRRFACRRTTPATRAVESSASMQKSWVSVIPQRPAVHDRPSRGQCKGPMAPVKMGGHQPPKVLEPHPVGKSYAVRADTNRQSNPPRLCG
jgi:hypothetical protein